MTTRQSRRYVTLTYKVSSALLLTVLATACADPKRQPGTALSSSAAAAVSSESAGSVDSAKVANNPNAMTPPSVTGLIRTATPAQRFAKDDAACNGGDKGACVRLANRYVGTGTELGCGVPRSRPFPTLKRLGGDDASDWKAYRVASHKACALGDQVSCKYADMERTSQSPIRDRFSSGARRDPTLLGLWVFRASRKPDVAKTLADYRQKCLEKNDCQFPKTALFTKEKAPADGKLTKALTSLAVDACEKTHDCDDIYMMLDKEGYTPEELAPVRAAFAKTLTEACVAGECTCGEATKYLPASDSSRHDLASLGCQNGEAEGCFALAELYKDGQSVDKSEARATLLYDTACPPIHPPFESDVSVGDSSPHACDHYAEIYLGGPYPGKDRDRGIYYANFACQFPGYEFDQAPCVRRGLEYATKHASTMHNGSDARSAAWADTDPLSTDNECSRPSVKEQCAELKKALAKVQ